MVPSDSWEILKYREATYCLLLSDTWIRIPSLTIFPSGRRLTALLRLARLAEYRNVPTSIDVVNDGTGRHRSSDQSVLVCEGNGLDRVGGAELAVDAAQVVLRRAE